MMQISEEHFAKLKQIERQAIELEEKSNRAVVEVREAITKLTIERDQARADAVLMARLVNGGVEFDGPKEYLEACDRHQELLAEAEMEVARV